MKELIKRDISTEEWREYEWQYEVDHVVKHRTYRIYNPKLLYFRQNGTTHRIVDGNQIAHCIPAPGIMGCVLRWKSLVGQDVVQF